MKPDPGDPGQAHPDGTEDDPERWLELFGNPLLSFALVRVNDRSIAEDLVQETFLAAISSRTTYEGRAARLTWLIGILRRKIVDHYRRAKTYRQKIDDLSSEFDASGGRKYALGSWPNDPEGTLHADEFWEVFHHCRRALPDNLLSAFTMREMDQATTEEVCDALGISASNLAVRVHRARLQMRRCLERKWFRNHP